MPNGYTANIKDGITFETFAMNCARAFGACVELRDESGGGEIIPDRFAPGDYHTKALAKTRAALSELEAMTLLECDRAAVRDYDDTEKRRVKALQDKDVQRAAYESMLAKVLAWVPPTEDHKGMRQFMIDQINESIRFDCCDDYYAAPTVRMGGGEWAASRRVALAHDLEYHTKSHAEEVSRAESRTAWVVALRSSLGIG